MARVAIVRGVRRATRLAPVARREVVSSCARERAVSRVLQLLDPNAAEEGGVGKAERCRIDSTKGNEDVRWSQSRPISAKVLKHI